jgi:predicted TIM-barrel fold metal-dependent hydrolase
MVLDTHVGGGDSSIYTMYKGPAFFGTFMIEDPWLGRRAMWLLTFTGAFERHPNLKLALTECPGDWWQLTVDDMDAAYFNFRAGALREFLPKKPSEYVNANVFLGASFMSRREAEHAVAGGYDDRCMWGSDYPHVEGTWMYTENLEDPSITRLSLANAYHGLPEASIRRMAGGNAFACFGLDVEALT